jgi:hypothetical protein
VGDPVLVAFLAAKVPGTVISVDEDMRGLSVTTADGETLRFVLRQTTGRFESTGAARARLYFGDAVSE